LLPEEASQPLVHIEIQQHLPFLEYMPVKLIATHFLSLLPILLPHLVAKHTIWQPGWPPKPMVGLTASIQGTIEKWQ
jgi:hypothetical protein